MRLGLFLLLTALWLAGCKEPKHDSVPATGSAAARSAADAASGAPLKVAFMYVSPVGDGGWTYTHDTARKLVETEFGNRVATTTVENVPEDATAEQTLRDLARRGNRLIFAASSGYMDAVLKVAPEFPEVRFEVASGDRTAANVASYRARTYEGAYLAGVVAGKMTRTGKLGFVGSLPVPEVIRNIDAFTLGAQSVNPNISTELRWVGSWFDPAKERAAALDLIGHHADVLIQSTNSPATLKTAEEKGVMAFGWDSDMLHYGPKAHLASAVIDWSSYYKERVAQVLDGSWQPKSVWLGIRERTIRLASPKPDLPLDVTLLLGEKTIALRDRTLHPFQGPLTDHGGTTRIAPDTAPGDAEIKNIDFYVKGVAASD